MYTASVGKLNSSPTVTVLFLAPVRCAKGRRMQILEMSPQELERVIEQAGGGLSLI